MINPYHLNIRQMQGYAGICLSFFCENFGIKHPHIDDLVIHLLSILTAKNLPEWDQKGTELVVTGRGDPLPDDVKMAIGDENLRAFETIVENCVEIGIVDMYGAATDRPRFFFDETLRNAQSYGVKLPPLEKIAAAKKGDDSWGEAIEEIDFANLTAAYGLAISR